MLTLTTLASGSSGNCILLSGGGEHILIDAGISCRRICRSLRALGVEPESLSGVLITHEHTDHISGLATLTKQFRLPVYASPGTARQLCYRIAALEDVLHACAPGGSFTLGSLDVETFPTLHDAAEPMGYHGHLSNEAGGALARDAVAHGARAVVLAHLSSENNTPEHARAAVERILSACGALADGVTLAVAPRSEPGPTYAL